MKNKKLFGVLSLLLATALIIPGCINKKDSSSSSEAPKSSSAEVRKFTVTFVSEGQTLQTSQVEEGSQAVYTGAEPTKAADEQAYRYFFRGWDKDITQSITEDTTFTATFAAYAEENVIDNFESYVDTGEVHDNGKWVPMKYIDGAWVENQGGAIDLSLNAVEGSKSVQLQSWTNGVGYKFAKKITTNEFTQASNALKFNLMTLSANTLKIIVVTEPIEYEGEEMTPSATYTMKVTSSEYSEYTIPMNGSWYLWNDPQYGTIAEAAEWTGIHQDDVVKKIKRIEFYLEAPSLAGNAKQFSFLDNVRFVTLDNPAETQVSREDQYTRYTGITASEHTMKIELGANNAATATILDTETPVVIPGSYALEGKQVTFTSTTEGLLSYTGVLSEGNQLIKRTASSSSDQALAAEVANMDLNAVQVMDGFEYASEGTAYYEGNLNKGTGFRGAYYSEYEGGADGKAWSGDAGNGWRLMGGSGDQMKLKTDGAGRGGSKYAAFKNHSTYSMRYMSWGLFDGSASQPGFRGSTFSFWARSYGKIKTMMVYAFAQPHPTFANRSDSSVSFTFYEGAQIDSWKHYEIDLNPSLTYYGFMFYFEKNGYGSDTWIYLDDVEVYTGSPYAQYVAPEPLSVPETGQYQARALGGIAVNIAFLSKTTAAIQIPGYGAKLTGTCALDGQTLTFNLSSGHTYVCTLSEDTKTITGGTVTAGDEGLIKQLLTNLSFTRINTETAETYSDSGTMWYQSNTEASRSGARGAYFCEYQGGNGASTKYTIGGSGWCLMGGSGDQLSLDTNHVEGSKSLKLKASNGGIMRYFQWDLYKGTNTGGFTGYSKFGFYLKNQAAAEVKLHVYVYKQAKVTSKNVSKNRVVKDITLAASAEWAGYTIDLDPNETYYGFALQFDKMASGTAFVNFDGAAYYNDYEKPNNSFFAKNGLVLTGKLNSTIDATITFGEKDAATLTCATLSSEPITGKYKMVMNGTAQTVELTIANSVIKANYAVDNTGAITATITEVTGDLQTQITSGSFTGSYVS